MKQFTFITCLLFTGMAFSQNINIPDTVFLDKLIAAGVDTNNDGQISYSEALAVTNLNVNSTPAGPKITNMEGIQYFTNLIQLRCSNNSITTLDVTSLTNLEILYCSSNQINSLNIVGLDQLTSVWVFQNELTAIDLTGLDNLWWFWVNDNNIDEIDLSGAANLEAIWIANNQLTEIDFSSTPSLFDINVSGNLITELDISQLNNLEILNCSFNQIENINISNLYNLKELYVGYNLLTEIDGSLSPNLKIMHCESNPDLEYINMKNGVVSGSFPGSLYQGFFFYDLPNLKFICMDPGEEYALSQSGYDPSNVTVSTTNCTMSINDFAFDSIILYPNPIKDTFYISNTENIIAYRVFDVLGKQNVTSTNLKSLQDEVLGLSPGYYFLELTSIENQKKVIQFLKQ